MPKSRNPENAWLPKRVYEHHGSYRYHQPDGEKINLGRDYKQAIAKWAELTEARIGPLPTMAHVMDRYLMQVAPMKAPATFRDAVREIANLRSAFGNMEPDAVEPKLIYAYMDKRNAPTRANRELSRLSDIFHAAIRWGAASNNPCLLVKRTPEFPRSNDISDEDLAFFRSVCTPLLQTYIDIKYLTGLRKGDILTLRRDQLKDKGIYVEPRKNLRRHPKTGQIVRKKARMYEWTPELRAAIDAALALPRRTGSLFVFAQRNGQSYYDTDKGRANTFEGYWRRAMVKAMKLAAKQGIVFSRFTEHDIRAKAGTDEQAATGQGAKLLGNTPGQFERAYNRGVENVTPLRKKP
jgi:integrase